MVAYHFLFYVPLFFLKARQQGIDLSIVSIVPVDNTLEVAGVGMTILPSSGVMGFVVGEGPLWDQQTGAPWLVWLTPEDLNTDSLTLTAATRIESSVKYKYKQI